MATAASRVDDHGWWWNPAFVHWRTRTAQEAEPTGQMGHVRCRGCGCSSFVCVGTVSIFYEYNNNNKFILPQPLLHQQQHQIALFILNTKNCFLVVVEFRFWLFKYQLAEISSHLVNSISSSLWSQTSNATTTATSSTIIFTSHFCGYKALNTASLCMSVDHDPYFRSGRPERLSSLHLSNC